MCNLSCFHLIVSADHTHFFDEVGTLDYNYIDRDVYKVFEVK